MLKIKLRISCNALDVSPDGKSALPAEERAMLERELRYEYRQLLRGQNAYALDGTRRNMRIEQRLLYTYDKYGKLVCGAGLLERVRSIFFLEGYDIEIEDITPVHPRPDRFKEDWDNVVRNFAFRQKQDIALAKIAGNYRGIVDAPTGFGKTFLYKAIGLLYPKANIVIVAKRQDVVQTIVNNLSKDLPNIGIVYGSKNKPRRITVCTARSLHKIDADNTDILIGEEMHELAAPTYSEAIAKFRFARMFGFTASPTGRLDNADMKLESLFGPVIFKMTYQEAVELNLVVPIKVLWLDVALPTNPADGYEDVPRLRRGIWRNDLRNNIIADAARAFGPEEQVLVMVTTFEHAVYLRQALPEFTLCYAERKDETKFGRFVKNELLPADEPVMTNRRRQELRKQFEAGTLKKVIATDVWSTGVSFDQLAVLIRADARGSEIMDTQIPGRVARLYETKPVGLLIDCLDQFDSGFMAAARKRRRNYEAKGWEQQMPGTGRYLIPR